MTSRSATLVGFSAVLMWSFLATLTVATGTVPPFLLAALTFAIGALVGPFSWLVRGQKPSLRVPWRAWAVGVGGLFGYHALYFLALRLAPPAEAGLVNYLWPLLIVLLTRHAPPRGRCDGACRHRAAVFGQGGIRRDRGFSAGLCRRLRRGFHLGALFSGVAVVCGGADRCGGRLLSGDGGAGGVVPPHL